jgi:thiamine biosynthesis lipoprotein
MTADSLATAVSVLGPEAGIRLIEQTPNAAVHIVRQPDTRIEVYESSRFKKFYEP